MSAKSSGWQFEFIARSRIRKTLLFYLIMGPHTPSELAAMERKHVSHISRALAGLRQRGLVDYTPSDSRQKYYKATDLGYATFVYLVRHAR